MDFTFYLEKQIELHPSMQMQDVIKMCYQAVFGVEHMLADKEKARQYFYQEYEATPASYSIPLYELISRATCRINLAAWKARDLDPEELFEFFVASAGSNVPGTKTDFLNIILSVERTIEKGLLPFSVEEWRNYCTQYKNNGMLPVHHSEAYRQAEHPAYRVVQKNLLHADLS